MKETSRKAGSSSRTMHIQPRVSAKTGMLSARTVAARAYAGKDISEALSHEARKLRKAAAVDVSEYRSLPVEKLRDTLKGALMPYHPDSPELAVLHGCVGAWMKNKMTPGARAKWIKLFMSLGAPVKEARFLVEKTAQDIAYINMNLEPPYGEVRQPPEGTLF